MNNLKEEYSLSDMPKSKTDISDRLQVAQLITRTNKDIKMPLFDDIAIGYMDKIDFECEIGLASGGNTIYPSIEDLKEHKKCVSECGIVKVEVKLIEVIEESKY